MSQHEQSEDQLEKGADEKHFEAKEHEIAPGSVAWLEARLQPLGITFEIQTQPPHVLASQDQNGYVTALQEGPCEAGQMLDAIQMAYLQWEYHDLHAQHFAGAAQAAAEEAEAPVSANFKAHFGEDYVPAGFDKIKQNAHVCQERSQAHERRAQRWMVLCLALQAGAVTADDTVDAAAIASVFEHLQGFYWLPEQVLAYWAREADACQALCAGNRGYSLPRLLANDSGHSRLQPLMRSMGIEDSLIIVGRYLTHHNYESYFTNQYQRLGWKKDEPMTDMQLAYLQWEYHNLHARYHSAVVEAGDDQRAKQRALEDLRRYFGQEYTLTDSKREQAQHHAELAQKWMVLFVALQKGTILDDQTVDREAMGSVFSDLKELSFLPSSILGYLNSRAEECQAFCQQKQADAKDDDFDYGLTIFLGDGDDNDDNKEEASFSDSAGSDSAGFEQKPGADDVSRSGLVLSAGACVLAAVACGVACMYAMPLLLPSVLGVAGHWAMVGVAAASGAALMGYDIQSQTKLSWMRALCGVLVLSTAAAGACALSHVVLPLLAAASIGSAGLLAAAGAGLTLSSMLGVGGLARRVWSMDAKATTSEEARSGSPSFTT